MCGEGTAPECERVVDWSERRRALMYVWYSTCQLELEGGRRGRMCPCAAVSLSDTPSFVCVRARPVHAIVHAWLASVPEVQGWGLTGWRCALATRLTPSGVCCHFSGGVSSNKVQKGKTAEENWRRFHCVGWRWVSFVRQPCLLPPGPPSFLPHVCFSIQHSTLTAL